jgi:hypothetical protein
LNTIFHQISLNGTSNSNTKVRLARWNKAYHRRFSPRSRIFGYDRTCPAVIPFEKWRTMADLRPFHIAFPVDNLEAARHFYGIGAGLSRRAQL